MRAMLFVLWIWCMLSPSLAGRDRILKKLMALSRYPERGEPMPVGTRGAQTQHDNFFQAMRAAGESRKAQSSSFTSGTLAREPEPVSQGMSPFDSDAWIAMSASIGGIALLAAVIYGVRSYMRSGAKEEAEGPLPTSTRQVHKARPKGLDSLKPSEDADMAAPTSGRLQGARSANNNNHNKILVPQDSQVDSTRSVNNDRGDFFTLTDIDLVSPGKGKYTSPRI